MVDLRDSLWANLAYVRGLFSAENALFLIGVALLAVFVFAIIKSYLRPYKADIDDPVYKRDEVAKVSRLVQGEDPVAKKKREEEQATVMASLQYGISTSNDVTDGVSLQCGDNSPRQLEALLRGTPLGESVLEKAFKSDPIDTIPIDDIDVAEDGSIIATDFFGRRSDSEFRWGNAALIETRTKRFSSNRPYKIILCHDMRGNYLNDVDMRGDSFNNNAFQVFNWELVDTFCYFSHHLLTIPPLSWINCCRRHGKACIGTFITEWDQGADICERIFATKERAMKTAQYMAKLCEGFCFDGWLINIENKLSANAVENLLEFLKTLRYLLKNVDKDNVLIWYDSVTKDGELQWQDKLSEKNCCFFDLCDGIFINYTWRPKNISESIDLLKSSRYSSKETSKLYFEGNVFSNISRRFDLYFGCDVFGRGTSNNLADLIPVYPSVSTPSLSSIDINSNANSESRSSSSSSTNPLSNISGGFHSFRSTLKAAEAGVSVALFAPGWVLENHMPDISPKTTKITSSSIEDSQGSINNNSKSKSSDNGDSINSSGCSISFQDYSAKLVSGNSQLFEGIDAVWRNYRALTNAEAFREIYYSTKQLADSEANLLFTLPLSVSFSQGMGKFIFVNGRRHMHPRSSCQRSSPSSSAGPKLAHSLCANDECAYYDISLQDSIVSSAVLHNIFSDMFSYRNNSTAPGVPKPIKLGGSSISSGTSSMNPEIPIFMFSYVRSDVCYEHAFEGSSCLSLQGRLKYSWITPTSNAAAVSGGVSTAIVVPILRNTTISNNISDIVGGGGGGGVSFDLSKYTRAPLKKESAASMGNKIRHIATLGQKAQAVFIRIAVGFELSEVGGAGKSPSSSTTAAELVSHQQSCISIKLSFSSQGHVNANNSNAKSDHLEFFKDTVILSDPKLANEFSTIRIGDRLNKSILSFIPYHIEKVGVYSSGNTTTAAAVGLSSVMWEVREYRLPPTALVDLISRDLISVDLICQTVSSSTSSSSSSNDHSRSSSNSNSNSNSNIKSSNSGGLEGESGVKENIMHKFGAYIGFLSIGTEMVSNLNIYDRSYNKTASEKEKERILEKFETDRARFQQKKPSWKEENPVLEEKSVEGGAAIAGGKISENSDFSVNSYASKSKNTSEHKGTVLAEYVKSSSSALMRNRLRTVSYSPDTKQYLIYFDVSASIASHVAQMKNSKASELICSSKQIPPLKSASNSSVIGGGSQNSDVFFELSKIRSKAIYACRPTKNHRRLLSIRYPDKTGGNVASSCGLYYYKGEEGVVNLEDDDNEQDELLCVTRSDGTLITIHESYTFPMYYRTASATPPIPSSMNDPNPDPNSNNNNDPNNCGESIKVDAILLKVIVQRSDFSYWEDRLQEQLLNAHAALSSSLPTAQKKKSYGSSIALPIYVILPVESMHG